MTSHPRPSPLLRVTLKSGCGLGTRLDTTTPLPATRGNTQLPGGHNYTWPLCHPHTPICMSIFTQPPPSPGVSLTKLLPSPVQVIRRVPHHWCCRQCQSSLRLVPGWICLQQLRPRWQFQCQWEDSSDPHLYHICPRAVQSCGCAANETGEENLGT